MCIRDRDAGGRAVKDAGRLSPGERLELRFSKGSASCLVESVNGGKCDG